MKHIAGRIGFWLLLPLSALQGLWLRRTAIRLPEAMGDRTGVCGQGSKIQLLAIGDSIIAGVGTVTMERSLPVHFAQALAQSRNCCVRWQVEANNGADIRQLRQRLGMLESGQKADVILVSIGVNDVTGLSSCRHWRYQLNALIADLKEKWPKAGVLFTGLPPMERFPLLPQPLRFTLGIRASDLDLIASEIISSQEKMLHIPTDTKPQEQEFCEDGFHPSAEICQSWAKELAQRFEAVNLAV